MALPLLRQSLYHSESQCIIYICIYIYRFAYLSIWYSGHYELPTLCLLPTSSLLTYTSFCSGILHLSPMQPWASGHPDHIPRNRPDWSKSNPIPLAND